ncbi:Oidioi.mRNA.OKI2018_I69.chr1.g1342.t1.cds [Oikopleura dioica]|uniref:Oidioi.mRNA.OKI2018_I69.chr1.g1342.t1.cds n=1 Tax=Oikopleura dioica TaxID=34765 RepID=A0ABN7SMM1_OIKDI|nr:Oidioi.mRNA.OKI2018_I69.chr1.g1342.t1.cds [Oikopleura dioica]
MSSDRPPSAAPYGTAPSHADAESVITTSRENGFEVALERQEERQYNSQQSNRQQKTTTKKKKNKLVLGFKIAKNICKVAKRSRRSNAYHSTTSTTTVAKKSKFRLIYESAKKAVKTVRHSNPRLVSTLALGDLEATVSLASRGNSRAAIVEATRPTFPLPAMAQEQARLALPATVDAAEPTAPDFQRLIEELDIVIAIEENIVRRSNGLPMMITSGPMCMAQVRKTMYNTDHLSKYTKKRQRDEDDYPDLTELWDEKKCRFADPSLIYTSAVAARRQFCCF